MNKNKLISSFDEFLRLTFYSVAICLVLFSFQYILELIEQFHLIDLNVNWLYIFTYSVIIFLTLVIELTILKFSHLKQYNVNSIDLLFISNSRFNAIKLVIFAFICCLLSFFIGLALGSEGPSVFIGGTLLYVFYYKYDFEDKKSLLHVGGSIGFSIAFMNPIAGLFYYFEQFKEKVKISNIIRLSYGLSLTYFIMVFLKKSWSIALFFEIENQISYNLLPYILLFSVSTYIIAKLLMFTLNKLSGLNLTNNKNIRVLLLILLFTCLIVFKIKFSGVIGSGSIIIKNILKFDALDVVIIFTLIRLFLVIFSFNINLSGGFIIPLLSIGILLGKIWYMLIPSYLEFNTNDEIIFVITIMIIFYASCSKNYITSIFLVGSFINIIYAILPLIVSLPLIISFDLLLKKITSKKVIANNN